MSSKILVAYATETGSTEGVAMAIGETLRELGAEVEVRLMVDTPDISEYDAVVAGSAIQGGKWLPHAMDWVSTHQEALNQKPFAAFLVSLTMAMKGEHAADNASSFLDPVRAIVPTVSEGLFAGMLDLSKIPKDKGRWGFRMSTWLGVWKEGDHRDWDKIRAWAEEIYPLLASTPEHSD